MKTGIAYFHTRDPRHFERDLDDIVEHACSFVVHCFSETDMAFYNQAMQKLIQMSKDRGLEVYLDPWGLGGLYGGETFSRFVAENLNARQIDKRGRSVAAACPNNHEFRQLQDQWIERAADMGADVCFWDEPHFHFKFMEPSGWEDWSCRCEACRRKFYEKYNEEMPIDLTVQVIQFRQDSVIDFLAHNCRESKRRRMKNCVCVLPHDDSGLLGRTAGTADWSSIAALEDVDIFGTDPYWILFGTEVVDYVRCQCEEVVNLCNKNNKEAQAWVQAFVVPEDRETEIEQAIDTMLDAGIQNIAAWGFRGCHLIDIRCARPELVWEIIGKRFRGIRGA